jgi:hypothetical protein
VPSPDLNKFVFFKSLENVRGVLIDDMSSDGRYIISINFFLKINNYHNYFLNTNLFRSEIIDIDKNDLFVMRYKPIGNYVKSDQMQLI